MTRRTFIGAVLAAVAAPVANADELLRRRRRQESKRRLMECVHYLAEHPDEPIVDRDAMDREFAQHRLTPEQYRELMGTKMQEARDDIDRYRRETLAWVPTGEISPGLLRSWGGEG